MNLRDQTRFGAQAIIRGVPFFLAGGVLNRACFFKKGRPAGGCLIRRRSFFVLIDGPSSLANQTFGDTPS